MGEVFDVNWRDAIVLPLEKSNFVELMGVELVPRIHSDHFLVLAEK
jgi:hypothetical protein